MVKSSTSLAGTITLSKLLFKPVNTFKHLVFSQKIFDWEKSKIEIRGNTATETTAVGISINYSIVNLSNKGAFTLEGSSKDGRVWFIGAQSFLILDVNPLPYDCK